MGQRPRRGFETTSDSVRFHAARRASENHQEACVPRRRVRVASTIPAILPLALSPDGVSLEPSRFPCPAPRRLARGHRYESHAQPSPSYLRRPYISQLPSERTMGRRLGVKRYESSNGNRGAVMMVGSYLKDRRERGKRGFYRAKEVQGGPAAVQGEGGGPTDANRPAGTRRSDGKGRRNKGRVGLTLGGV